MKKPKPKKRDTIKIEMNHNKTEAYYNKIGINGKRSVRKDILMRRNVQAVVDVKMPAQKAQEFTQ